MSNNPLHHYYRAPKLYTQIPSDGSNRVYGDGVITMPESGELPVYAMTAKDEMMMKNPDALLNGEAVSSVISSCIPGVQNPRQLITPDVDTLLIAIQGATYGDMVKVETECPECSNVAQGVASIDYALQTMRKLPQDLALKLDNGLTINLRPITYETTVKAGLTSFQSTRSLQGIAQIEDELEQIRAFNNSYRQMAALNFEILVDSVRSIQGVDDQGEPFVVQDRPSILSFMENCENSVGRAISEFVEHMSGSGANKTTGIQCDNCEHQFETTVSFDPVNFFTAS